MSNNTSQVYKAWDLPTRLFHWINFICVVLLSILGLIMLNKGAIGISGLEAGVGLKVLHVLVGYVFTVNLLFRLLWGFVGGKYSRWSSLIPGRKFTSELKHFNASTKTDAPQTFVGHNPKGRLSVLMLFLLMTVIMVTGLVRAATDIYYPPFGGMAAEFVAAEGVSPATIKPYDKTGTDPEKYAELRAFSGVYGQIHVYGVYVLWLLILIHIMAVVMTETSARGTIISSMFSGRKHLPRPPVDQ